ncbi:hypothetical protein Godav_014124, partial [Gossypium davidsonii]|nr:hypothetical protein [Gossypium davidsonii]
MLCSSKFLSQCPMGTKYQQRNKELAPAEEQRTSTSRRTKNQHQQRIKEAVEEQIT